MNSALESGASIGVLSGTQQACRASAPGGRWRRGPSAVVPRIAPSESSAVRVCRGSRRAVGFSLIEVVIVIVIIAIIAAIALPRFTNASLLAAEAALRSDLRMLRTAIATFAAEHGGRWPASISAGEGMGTEPCGALTFERHLTWYTAFDGRASQQRDAVHRFGPYLQKIPALPLGENEGSNGVACVNEFGEPGEIPTSGIGWEYNVTEGLIRPHTPAYEVGSNGVPYYQW